MIFIHGLKGTSLRLCLLFLRFSEGQTLLQLQVSEPQLEILTRLEARLLSVRVHQLSEPFLTWARL
jgi:hypothetical protein